MDIKVTILKFFTMKEILDQNLKHEFDSAGNLWVKDHSVAPCYFGSLGGEFKAPIGHDFPSWMIEEDRGF